MAELLLRWLNDELNLSKNVTDMEVDFASGYLLGEIMYRLNRQHNFAAFTCCSSADAKIQNFCLLEPTLRNLNVKFDANIAISIMNEKKNAAARLLYEIKIAATRVARAPGVSTKSFNTTGIVPLHNRFVKLAKPTYDSESLRIFEQAIRRRVIPAAVLQQEKCRQEEETKQHEDYLAKMAEQRETLAATKAERLHCAYIHSCYIKQALNETDSSAWRLAMEKKSARMQRRAAFLQQILKKRREAKENMTLSLRQKVQNDLNAFDILDRSKIHTVNGKVCAQRSTGYGLRSLTTALNATFGDEAQLYSTSEMEMGNITDVIKLQRKEREKRKESLSRRRKRFVQECIYSYSQINEFREASILEKAVLRNTNSENEIQSKLNSILIYKEVARENRLWRNQEYAIQEELDSMAAEDRDSSCHHNLLCKLKDNNEMQIIQRDNVQESIEAARHLVNQKLSGAIMSDIVDFVLFIAGVREESVHSRDSAVFIAPETWNEYKVLFMNGFNFGLRVPEESIVHSDLLDSHELEQYLSSSRPLCNPFEQQRLAASISTDARFLGATVVIEECFVLGEVIKSLRWIALSAQSSEAISPREQPERTTELMPQSHQELRILIFGPPFAGKETQAKLLGETYKLAVLSVDELIEKAITASSEIGQQVQHLLGNGDEVSPELYSRLVIDATQSFDKAGWIIYGLPATAQHAQNLNEYLTGFKDSAVIPSPNDFESVIAPGRPKPHLCPNFFHGKSGVDLVFHIDCSFDAIFNRSLGSVDDCAKNEDGGFGSTRILRRHEQHVKSSTNASEFLTLHCLAVDGFSHDHKSWHAKFKTLHEPCSTAGMSVSEVNEAIGNVINQLLGERQMQAESMLHQQEVVEQMLMADEEERQNVLSGFESKVNEAQTDVAAFEKTLAIAEEAKAKREELLELRQKLDEAKRQLECITDSYKRWIGEAKSPLKGELSLATAQALTALWNDMEQEYISTMKESFRKLRELRHDIIEHTQRITREFCDDVRRPDRKQEVVHTFQNQFNDVNDDMRFDDVTKNHLHACVDMFQDELEALIENKVAENDKELKNILDDGWTEDICRHAAIIYHMALQAECDRFRISIDVLVCGHYAASSDRSRLDPIMELWQSHQPQLEAACRIFQDPVKPESTPVGSPVKSAAAGKKSVLKGKGKAAVPGSGSMPSVSTAASNEGAQDQALTIEELQAEYTHILHRCGAWMEAMASLAKTSFDKNVEGDKISENDTSICEINLLNGIKYEHQVMERRIHYLQESTEKCCHEITRSMRSLEMTLRDVSENRKGQEQVAVAAVIEHVRAAIENEVALPYLIDVAPEIVPRFPITLHLREDTRVLVDKSRRLLPQSPPHPPPIIEETHQVLLNHRQRDNLRDALISQTISNSGLLPLINVIETITASTSELNALPDVWRESPAHVIAKIVSEHTVSQSAFVDVEALLTTMTTRDDLLVALFEQ